MYMKEKEGALDERTLSLVQYGLPQLLSSNLKPADTGKKKKVFRSFLTQDDVLKIRGALKSGRDTQVANHCSPEKESAYMEQDILNLIAPPRLRVDRRRIWQQQVSSVPSTKSDAVDLRKKIQTLMKLHEGDMYGTCSVRRSIYTQAFDELIRHVSVNCAERGLLLIHVRDDLNHVMNHLTKLYTSAVAYGIRKTLQGLAMEDKLLKKIKKLKLEVDRERKIYEETFPIYKKFRDQHKLSTVQADNEYTEELDKLVKKKNHLKLLVQQSVGPKKPSVKNVKKEVKMTFKAAMAGGADTQPPADEAPSQPPPPQKSIGGSDEFNES